jgi:hypothetical protein
MFQELMHS